MFYNIALVSGCATIFAGTAYIVGIIVAPAPTYRVTSAQRLSTFEDIAPDYERKTKQQEFYLGIGRLRRRLLAEHANGRVLEVGAGTAANVGFYPPERIDEVVLSDRAQKMCEQAEKKVVNKLGYAPYHYPSLPADDSSPIRLDKATRSRQQRDTEREYAEKQRRHDAGDKTAFTLSDAHPPADAVDRTEDGGEGLRLVSTTSVLDSEGLAELQKRRTAMQQRSLERRKALAAQPAHAQGVAPNPNSNAKLAEAREKQLYSVANYPAEHLPFADNEFDTVVDMFGLCSFEDPVAALGEMSRVCKPNGRLLLLEHGRGTWERLNWYLDKWAPRHAASWGCWWNRDIRRAIRTAGVTILSKEEKHFGTTMMIVAAPYKRMSELEVAGRKA